MIMRARRLFVRVAALVGATILFPAPHARAFEQATESVAQANVLRHHALVDETAYRLVTSLTTDIGARPAGSVADAQAVEWAMANLRALGYDKVYKQPVTFPVWKRVSESASVLSPSHQRLVITALGGSIGTSGDLQAEVVCLSDIETLHQTSSKAIRGKIVLLTQRVARRTDGSGYAQVVRMRTSAASIAARKGARALLIRSLGTSNNRLAHTGSVIYEDDAAIPAAALSSPDADLLERLLKKGHPVQVRMNVKVELGHIATSYNVIGEITGRRSPEEIVMLAAHLDSWDLGVGAVDDGFGVAVTMAAGALIRKVGNVPDRTIRVVLFANEENGFYGAKAYVNQNRSSLSKHVVAVESDWGAGRVYALRNVKAQPTLANHLAQALTSLGVALDEVDGAPGPDIQFLAKESVPWVQLAQDASALFDHHHSDNDTLDKIDPLAMKQNVAAYVVYAWLMANQPAQTQP